MDGGICQGFRNTRRNQFSFIFQAVTACSLNVILQFTPNLLQGVLSNTGNAPSPGFCHQIMLYFTLLLRTETPLLDNILKQLMTRHQLIPHIVSQHVVVVQNITSFSDKCQPKEHFLYYSGPLGVNWE